MLTSPTPQQNPAKKKQKFPLFRNSANSTWIKQRTKENNMTRQRNFHTIDSYTQWPRNIFYFPRFLFFKENNTTYDVFSTH